MTIQNDPNKSDGIIKEDIVLSEKIKAEVLRNTDVDDEIVSNTIETIKIIDKKVSMDGQKDV